MKKRIEQLEEPSEEEQKRRKNQIMMMDRVHLIENQLLFHGRMKNDEITKVIIQIIILEKDDEMAQIIAKIEINAVYKSL